MKHLHKIERHKIYGSRLIHAISCSSTTVFTFFYPPLKRGKSAFIRNVVYPRCSNLAGLFIIVPVALGATFREIRFGLPELSFVKRQRTTKTSVQSVRKSGNKLNI